MMKKTYSKPAMHAERFALATHIAACSGYAPGSATNATRTYCGYMLGYQYVFNSGVPACELPIDAAEYGSDCYNGPFLDQPGEPFGS